MHYMENTLLSGSPRSQAVNLQLQGLLLPGTFGFSRCRLQIPVGQRGGQWLIPSDGPIFNRSKLKKLRTELWDCHHLNHLDLGAPDLHYFLLGDNAFALMPWLVKPYSRRQLTKEERIDLLNCKFNK